MGQDITLGPAEVMSKQKLAQVNCEYQEADHKETGGCWNIYKAQFSCQKNFCATRIPLLTSEAIKLFCAKRTRPLAAWEDKIENLNTVFFAQRNRCCSPGAPGFTYRLKS